MARWIVAVWLGALVAFAGASPVDGGSDAGDDTASICVIDHVAVARAASTAAPRVRAIAVPRANAVRPPEVAEATAHVGDDPFRLSVRRQL